ARVHGRPDVLHGVVDREERRDRTTRGVDVEEHVLVGVIGFEVQQLGHDQVRHGVVDRRSQEDDAVLEKPAVDVIGPFPAAGGLGDVRNGDVTLGSHHSSSVDASAPDASVASVKISPSTTSPSTMSPATTSPSTTSPGKA